MAASRMNSRLNRMDWVSVESGRECHPKGGAIASQLLVLTANVARGGAQLSVYETWDEASDRLFRQGYARRSPLELCRCRKRASARVDCVINVA
jgi:hypothetical protein